MGMQPSAAGRRAAARAGPVVDAAAVEESSLSLVEMTLSALAGTRDVSLLQLRALLVVDRHAPLNLSTLAARLDLSVPSASRIVERLVDAGLVERGAAAHSRREVALAVTSRGRQVLSRLRRARREAIADVLTRMTVADRVALVGGLTAFGAATDD